MLVFAVLFSFTAFAAIPRTINFQGRILQPNSTPLIGMNYLTFHIYDGANNPVWSETDQVSLDAAGVFNVVLGNSSTNPLAIDFSQPYSIEVVLNNTETFTPKQQLSAVPYAFYALTAESVVGGGATGGSYVPISGGTMTGTLTNQANVIVSGKVGIGTSEPNAQLDVRTSGSLNLGNPSTKIFFGTALRGVAIGQGDANTGIIQGTDIGGTPRALSLNGIGSGVVVGGYTYPGSVMDIKGNLTVGGTYTGTAAPANGLIVQGSVGIGTTTPVTDLDIYDNSTAIYGEKLAIRRSGAGDVGISLQQNGTTSFGLVSRAGPGSGLALVDNFNEGGPGVEVMRVKTTGVGIATTEPQAMLDVNGTVRMAKISAPSSPVAGMIYFDGTHFRGYNGSVWKQLDN